MATLPENVGFDTALQSVERPTNTYLIDTASRQIIGMDAGLPAMRQAIEIILNVERYRWQIYTSNFGVELDDLIGDEYDYITSEFPRRVTDALSTDDRVISVDSFSFSQIGLGKMLVTFTVQTVYGSVEQEVTI